MKFDRYNDAWKGTSNKSTNNCRSEATIMSPINVGGKLMWR